MHVSEMTAKLMADTEEFDRKVEKVRQLLLEVAAALGAYLEEEDIDART